MNNAKQILAALSEADEQAYLVGGVVRDYVLGREAHDIDICTSADPDKIMRVAAQYGWHAIPIGAAFGCITVCIGGRQYEVTTFRAEVYGDDAHRPTEVRYGVSLADDLARRDFTMNALALDRDGKIIDLFGGQEDMKQGIIRAIGDARVRFTEDALRMFRAVRFSAQLGFGIDTDIQAAIREQYHLVRGLSVERVRSELEKMLLAPYAAQGFRSAMQLGLLDESATVRMSGKREAVTILPELRHLVGLKQNPAFHIHDAWEHTLAVLNAAPRTLTLRWAALLHDAGKGLDGIRGEKNGQPTDYGHAEKSSEIARAVGQRLRLPKPLVRRIAWLVGEHMGCAAESEKGALRWLKKRCGYFDSKEELLEALGELEQLLTADGIGTGYARPSEWERAGISLSLAARRIPLYTAELAIGGRDLVPIVGAGPQVRGTLDNLLARVQAGSLANTREALLAAAEKAEARRRERAGDSAQ